MFMHGHFHSDPHPGNVLLLDDGSLGLIDFGSTGRLDPRQRTALIEMTAAAMRGDSAGLLDAVEHIASMGPDAAMACSSAPSSGSSPTTFVRAPRSASRPSMIFSRCSQRSTSSCRAS